jgi:hypothetical protein
MATTQYRYQSTSGIRALLDQIYEIKFNKHVPLTVIMLSTIYTVYRTHHYLGTAFNMNPWVTWPTSIFIELLVLGSSAMLFIALRADYIANAVDKNTEITNINVNLMFGTLGISFLALLGLAMADAWSVTHDVIPSFVMTLVQAAQMLFICGFIINATVDERDKIDIELAELEKSSKTDLAAKCPYCFKSVLANNRSRHMRSCPMRSQ